MELKEVMSSTIKSVGFEQGMLEIAFKSNETYRYLGVPRAVYEGLMTAESKGKYFAEHIKGKYGFMKAML